MLLVARPGPCDAESASRQEDDHARRPMLANTPHNRHRSTRLDARKSYAGTPTIGNARSLWFPFHSPGNGSGAHRARLSRVVTAALLSEVAEVVTLPDLRSKAPEDRVRDRDVEEEVGQNQVPDVVVAAAPPAHDVRRHLVCAGLRAGNLVWLTVLQEAAC